MRMRTHCPPYAAFLRVARKSEAAHLREMCPSASHPTEWILRLVMTHIEIRNVSKDSVRSAAELWDVSSQLKFETGRVNGRLEETVRANRP